MVFKDKGKYHVVSSGILMQNISIFDQLGRLLFNVNNISSDAIQINELHQTKEILLLKIVDENLQTHYRKILN